MSALQFSEPGIPSTSGRCISWNVIAAAFVFGPNSHSADIEHGQPPVCLPRRNRRVGDPDIQPFGIYSILPQHFLYFFPLPQGQGSFG